MKIDFVHEALGEDLRFTPIAIQFGFRKDFSMCVWIMGFGIFFKTGK